MPISELSARTQAIHQRVADIDQSIAEHHALRKKLIDHIGWFKHKQRKLK